MLSIHQSALLGVAGNAPAYGVGIATSTIIATSSNSAPLAVLICGFAMIGILIAYQRLNDLDPNCGAAFHWVGKHIHPIAGFLAGWCLLVALQFFMISAMVAAGQAVADLAGIDSATNKLLIFAVGFLILILVTIPSLLGASVFGRFQSLLTSIELMIVTVIAVSVIVQNGAGIERYLIDQFRGDNYALNANDLSKGIVVAVFFFWGWDVIFNLSEETIETRKTSADAALYTVAVLILIYFTFTVLGASLLTEPDAANPGQNVLITFAHKALPAPYGNIALVAFLISVIGSLDASIIQFSRTLLSKSRSGILDRRFGQVSFRFGVPTFAILATVCLATVLMAVSYFSGTVAEIIVAGVAGSAVFVAYYYGFAGLACALFFAKRENRRGIRDAIYVLWPLAASTILILCAIFSAKDFGTITTVTVSSAFALGLGLAMFSHQFLSYK